MPFATQCAEGFLMLWMISVDVSDLHKFCKDYCCSARSAKTGFNAFFVGRTVLINIKFELQIGAKGCN